MNSDAVRQKFLATSEENYQQEKKRQLIRMIVFTAIAIFSIETLLMILLELVLDIPEPLVWFIDGFFLVVCLFPLNYYYVVLPMLRQIEEHRHSYLELAKTNEVIGRFFTISDVLIAYLDVNFNFIRVNKAYADSDQHGESYYIGKNHFDLFPNEENQRIFESVVKSGQNFSVLEKPFEYVGNPERGVTYWDWSLMPVKNQENQIAGLILVLNDVTLRKNAQSALVDSERRFRAVFNHTFQHTLLLTPDGRLLLANQTTLNFTGSQPDVINGEFLWNLPWWEDTTRETKILEKYIRQAAEGRVVRCEMPVLSANDGRAVMDITIKPLLDDQGQPILLIYEARDITFQILAKEALIRNKEEIKRLYEAEKQAHQMAETMRSAALALSSSLNIDTVLDTLLDYLSKAIPYTSAHLDLLEDEDHLHVRLARGEKGWEKDRQLLGRHLELNGVSIFETLLNERKTIHVAETASYKGSSYFPGQRYIGSFIVLPLLAGDQIIGLCILEHIQPYFFTPEMVQLATILTNQAAFAIQNAWLFEQVRDSREHLQALSRRLVEVQESERHHIAYELHDEAGQALASLMVGLRLLERDSGDLPAVVARTQELRRIAESIMENLHRLVIALRPASLDHLGLVAALRQHTETVSNQHGLAVQFEVIGEMERLPGEVETAIYRIVQEALTNVVRHAHATHVDVLLERRESALIVIVEDNGVGFDSKVPEGDHLGIIGMRERADMLGGSMTFERSPNGGTAVILEVPWQYES